LYWTSFGFIGNSLVPFPFRVLATSLLKD
jgi:hypothetical protein